MSFRFATLDPRTEAENPGFRRQVQEAGPEEGEGVCGRDDEGTPGLQAQRLNGPEGQPQVCEEGGRQAGQGTEPWEPPRPVGLLQPFTEAFSPLPQVLTSEVGDWRKNVEAMSGMEGRKKMFDTGGAGQ